MNRFTHASLSIRTRLLGGLLILGVLTAFLSLTGINSLQRQNHDFDVIVDHSTPELIATLRIEATSAQLLADFITLQNTPGSTAASNGPATDAKNTLLADLEDLNDHKNDFLEESDESSTREAVASKAATVYSRTSQFITSREQGLTPAQLGAIQTQLRQSITELQDVITTALVEAQVELAESHKQSDQTAATQVQRYALLGVGAVMLALIIGLLLARSIIRPLGLLKTGANNIADGKLDSRINLTTHDEIGELAATFNAMADKLKHSYHELELSKAGVERTVRLRTLELTEERTRFLASINSLPLGFMLIEPSGNIAMMNPTMSKMLSLTEKQLTSKNLNDHIRKQMPLLDQILQRCQDAIQKKKGTVYSEVTFSNKYLRILLSPVRIDATSPPQAVVALVEDITEAKVIERSKDEFFSIASHELRTPLTAIRGNTSMIKQYYPKVLKDPALEGMVDDIHSSSLRLIDIVNDFLDTSRLEQGKMKFILSEFSFEEVVERVIYELDGLSRERHIWLKMENDLDTLPHVFADKDRVKQIVYNLVGNAMRFVEKGGVTIRAEVQGKDYLKVYVIDTGKGISPEGQNLLFHKFQQAGESILTRDNTRGTGLGLYISKLLLENMHGAIQLEHSEIGKGTTFSFTLPLAKLK